MAVEVIPHHSHDCDRNIGVKKLPKARPKLVAQDRRTCDQEFLELVQYEKHALHSGLLFQPEASRLGQTIRCSFQSIGLQRFEGPVGWPGHHDSPVIASWNCTFPKTWNQARLDYRRFATARRPHNKQEARPALQRLHKSLHRLLATEEELCIPFCESSQA
ncbi:Uncharacterised protein [uncultured archaeon]|nr:Uncharacterised protein [uncultured archaeon]